MTTKTEFAKFMAMLTRAIPRFAPKVDDMLLDAWFSQLGHLSTQELSSVYGQATRRFDQFPSMREILDLAGRTEASEEDKAREVAERIWSCIGRVPTFIAGSRNNESKLADLKANLGPIGWEVVRLAGDWNEVCESATFANMTTLKAQWREVAAALIRKHRTGDIYQAPQFDSIPDNAHARLPDTARAEIRALSEKFRVARDD